MLGTSSGAAHRALQHGPGCYIGERRTLRRCTRRNSSRSIVRAECDGIGDLAPKPALRAPPPRPIPQPNRTAAVEQVLRTKKQGPQGVAERGRPGDDSSSRNGVPAFKALGAGRKHPGIKRLLHLNFAAVGWIRHGCCFVSGLFLT